MSRYISFSVENVLFSIVNTKETTTQLDIVAPFSFVDFLKYTKESYSPTQYNDFYLFYLNAWSLKKNESAQTSIDTIKNQYTAFLKEITLNYSTIEEKKFLSNLDFSDPNDLEIAIPFYSSKIKEIVVYYKNQREKIQTAVPIYKQNGTPTTVQKIFANNILNYLFNNVNLYNENSILQDLEQNIDIYVDELVDVFSEYYNLDPSPSVNETDLRKKYYTANYNEIDPNIFINFDAFLVSQIFSNTFITELGVNFSINVNLTYDPYCSPETPLGNLIKAKTVNDIDPNNKIILQQKVLQKYMGVDLHYITKNSDNEILSGVLIKAVNPSGNFLNVTNPSTATVPANQLVSLRKLGLYFTPDKVGLLKFDIRKKNYFIEPSVLQTDIVYVYPDPSVYGNVQYTDLEMISPVSYAVDYSVDIKNASSSYIYGDPKIETRDQPYFAYFSNQQLNDGSPINIPSQNVNLASLYNVGSLYSFKTDIYGNQYGLFKNNYNRYITGDTNFLSGVDVDTLPAFLNSTLSASYNSLALEKRQNYQFKDLYYKSYQSGSVYVRNILTNSVLPLSTALEPIFFKYSETVKNEIYNSVLQIEIFYDTIVIETPNFLVFDKITVNSDGTYAKSTISNTYFTKVSSSLFSTFSNRIFVDSENKIYFYQTTVYDIFANDYSKIMYPSVYAYDITTTKIEQIFTLTPQNIELSSIFSNQALKVEATGIGPNIIRIDSSKISYNSLHKLFNICYVGKDLNSSPYIFTFNFNKTYGGINFTDAGVYDTIGDPGDSANVINEQNSSIGKYKGTLNYYSLSSNDPLITVITSSLTASQDIYVTPQIFNSSLNTPATINNNVGVLQI